MLILSCLGWVLPVISDALTVEEVLLLKQHGVSEQTIQIMLQSEMHAAALEKDLAGEAMGVKTITRPDGKAAIIYSSGSGNQDASDTQARLNEERAWEMLRHILVDARVPDGKGPRSAD
jgi:hypothetical protein